MRSPFTAKGFIVGTVFAVAVSLCAPYVVFVLQASAMGINSSSPGAIFFFFLLVFAVNTLLGMIGRCFCLGRGDLVLVYAMLMVAVTAPTYNFLNFLIVILTGPYYFATAENEFAGIYHPYIPEWMVPRDRGAIFHLYEGLPRGESIPWGAWIEPLGHWFAFYLALSFMMFCMAAIMHRQWSRHERLSYPMVQLPARMLDGADSPGSRILPFFRKRGMWLGFAIPFTLFSLTGLNHYFPAIPEFPFYLGWVNWFRSIDAWGEGIALSYAWLGFFYLVDLEISFSIWFFYLLLKLQGGLFRRLGIASTERLSYFEYSQTADFSHQAAGAVIAFVLYGLWIARRHLRDVAVKAWRPSQGVDDSEELMPYRLAFFGMIGSGIFVCAWLWRSGIPLAVLPLFFGICLVYYLFVTRLVAASGVPTARPPLIAPYFVISGMGTSILGAKGLVALGFTMAWQAEMRMSPMLACANALKLAESVPGSKRRLLWAMLLALLCSLAAATWMNLRIGYTYGGNNLGTYPGFAYSWHYLLSWMHNPTVPDLRGWVFTGIGGAVEGFLLLAQKRWSWWPLHPLGFTVAVGWLTSEIWFPAFLAWALKAVILGYGGLRVYRFLKPVFLGMILGEVTVAGFWAVIDAIAGGTGNVITYM